MSSSRIASSLLRAGVVAGLLFPLLGIAAADSLPSHEHMEGTIKFRTGQLSGLLNVSTGAARAATISSGDGQAVFSISATAADLIVNASRIAKWGVGPSPNANASAAGIAKDAGEISERIFHNARAIFNAHDPSAQALVRAQDGSNGIASLQSPSHTFASSPGVKWQISQFSDEPSGGTVLARKHAVEPGSLVLTTRHSATFNSSGPVRLALWSGTLTIHHLDGITVLRAGEWAENRTRAPTGENVAQDEYAQILELSGETST